MGSRKFQSKGSSASAKKLAAKKQESSEEENSSDEELVQGQPEDDEGSDDSQNDDGNENEQTRKGKSFSDQNSKWLKPKKKEQLLSSDDEDDGDEMLEASDDDNDEEELEVERKSRLLDARHEEELEEADDEMRETVAKHTAIYHLPTKEELDQDVDRVIPPSELRGHVDSILEVLADFKKRREPGRPRSEYIERYGGFLAELYGYLPELVEYFLTMFSPAETLEFIDYSDKPRPMVVRTNTLKTRRKDLALALMKRGVSLDPLASWSKVGLKIMESSVPIGATPEYLSGHYMLQSAASMCPVLALAPEPQERVLDMSAAPGGKTSYLAQLMRNTGVVFANDLRPDRQKATVANIHRLGVKNVVACSHDGRKMPKLFRHYKFDRVLLDAPCSGLGVISRDPSCKVQRTMADILKTAHLQKELLLAAIDMLNHKSKTGGVMVYSTCSVSVAENEEVVNYALSKRDIKIVDTGLDFGKPGFTRYQNKRFHPSTALTRRFYPHVHNMDGFYVCKIQKLSDHIKTEEEPSEVEGEVGAEEIVDADEKKSPLKTNVVASSKEKGGKKRPTKSESEPLKKKAKSDKLSIPPTPTNKTQASSKKKGSKKRPTKSESEPLKKKVKSDKLSIPPTPTNKTQKKDQKKTLSAKMTKPRRQNRETMT